METSGCPVSHSEIKLWQEQSKNTQKVDIKTFWSCPILLGSTIESSPSEEPLGITIDSELTFHKHITSLCSKSNQKLSALARIAKYMTIDKCKFVCYGTIKLLFSNLDVP